MSRLLVIDNYDSFTWNLVQMFMGRGLSIEVHRNDRLSVSEAFDMSPDLILVSPGPGDPGDAGISMEIIRRFADKVPLLGVCLGMQCLNEVFGGETVRAGLPMHGKTSDIYHDNRGLFAGLPLPFPAARYHSLAVRPGAGTLEALTVSARTKDQVIMGLSHREYPLHGVQFHPESFLTPQGFIIIDNFLRMGA
ncbi:aminodeoxychorismate synthase, subunit II [Candidatus Desulfarcum epimagneticum]|uniref:Aminodeoxychorismate synthase, subunit II n=1 Tax=uncultured Desulfobacteraceae bacterium TaxID=218296 RepID=A0A484HK07_9BACT|nr:aminodeoxychorismate synthase, subunit II [uncultured Desulfobacteraceae bacterium]